MSVSDSAPVRAVICDVYGTLLSVGPPPAGATAQWAAGCQALLTDLLSLTEFNARTAAAVAAENASRRQAGEPYPDVDWLALLRRVFGREMKCHDAAPVKSLSDLHARCVRTCSAMPGALTALHRLRSRGVILGIASNAQDYTRGELSGAGVSPDMFHSGCCFLSGEQGFAKPSARVFEILSGRLHAMGIEPRETLMVGDSLVNDVAPAAAAGWQTWHLDPGSGAGWEPLADSLAALKTAGAAS